MLLRRHKERNAVKAEEKKPVKETAEKSKKKPVKK
jgi:hypothetical protein